MTTTPEQPILQYQSPHPVRRGEIRGCGRRGYLQPRNLAADFAALASAHNAHNTYKTDAVVPEGYFSEEETTSNSGYSSFYAMLDC